MPDRRHDLAREVCVECAAWEVSTRFYAENITQRGAYLRGRADLGPGGAVTLVPRDTRERRWPG